MDYNIRRIDTNMTTKPSNTQLPYLSTAVMPLFPTLDSLQEVVDFAESKLPINSRNDIYTLLMIYHNTLLKEIHDN